MKIYERFFKRFFDFFFSLLLLIVLSPVLLSVSLAVLLNLGRPIIFKQDRPGLNERIFRIYKFRTMINFDSSESDLLDDSKRLTTFGRRLRSTSLDELPELFNILKGDMSFVGPRPLAVQYLGYYTPTEALRHSVRPGLTGLAQVNGRNTSEWEVRFKYDIDYIGNITFLNDLKIIFKTIAVTIRRSDIGERGISAPIDLDVQRKANL